MTHPNRWTNVTQIKTEAFGYAHSCVGIIVANSGVPFLARVVSVEENDGKIVEAYEPVSVEEMRQYYANSLYKREADDSDEEWRECEIRNMAMELVQDSWYAGVPRDATVYCHGCAEERPAHGSNLYDAVRLCNRCVERYEIDYAKGKTLGAQAWVAAGLQVVLAQQSVKKAQEKGYVVHPLPDGRYAETYALYIRADASPYSGEQFREEHWPTGLIPTMYQVYIRSDMTEMADCEQQIVCTEAYKLGVLFAEGVEKLLAYDKREKERKARRATAPLEELLGWDKESE